MFSCFFQPCCEPPSLQLSFDFRTHLSLHLGPTGIMLVHLFRFDMIVYVLGCGFMHFWCTFSVRIRNMLDLQKPLFPQWVYKFLHIRNMVPYYFHDLFRYLFRHWMIRFGIDCGSMSVPLWHNIPCFVVIICLIVCWCLVLLFLASILSKMGHDSMGRDFIFRHFPRQCFFTLSFDWFW